MIADIVEHSVPRFLEHFMHIEVNEEVVLICAE
jgi:hypothetical protein